MADNSTSGTPLIVLFNQYLAKIDRKGKIGICKAKSKKKRENGLLVMTNSQVEQTHIKVEKKIGRRRD